MNLRRHRPATNTSNGALTLDAVERDKQVKVLRVSGRPLLMQRLAALGLVPGVWVTIVKPHCPAIVRLAGARIAIGRSAARSIEVEMADE